MRMPCCRPAHGRYALVVMLDATEADDGWAETSERECFAVAWLRVGTNLSLPEAASSVVRVARRLMVNETMRLDVQRVFLAGRRTGAALVYEIAMRGPHLFAAFAASGGLPLAGTSCVPMAPRPLLHVHAMDDALVPASGRPTYDSVLTTLDAIKSAAGACRPVADEWAALSSAGRTATQAASASLPWLSGLHGWSLFESATSSTAPPLNATAHSPSHNLTAERLSFESTRCALHATCVGGADVVRCLGAFGPRGWPRWEAELAWRFFVFSAARAQGGATARRPLVAQWAHHGSPSRAPPCPPSLPLAPGATSNEWRGPWPQLPCAEASAPAVPPAPPPLLAAPPLPPIQSTAWSTAWLAGSGVAVALAAAALLRWRRGRPWRGTRWEAPKGDRVVVTHVAPIEGSEQERRGGSFLRAFARA